MKTQKALFLDRDGIINVDHGYVSKIADFEFSKGIFELVKLFVDAGYMVCVVTNQSGIGRGYYSQEAFQTLSSWMIEQFQANGIEIKAIQHCPHLPNQHCHCRKPHTGMVEAITTQYPITLRDSWLIGDKQSDIDLALNAGIGQSISIGNKEIAQSTLHFETILSCKTYIENNQGRL